MREYVYITCTCGILACFACMQCGTGTRHKLVKPQNLSQETLFLAQLEDHCTVSLTPAKQENKVPINLVGDI